VSLLAVDDNCDGTLVNELDIHISLKFARLDIDPSVGKCAG
jgi:hypothetical protein